MTAASLLGCSLLASAPVVASCLFFLPPKPVLVLTILASTFFWLVFLLAISFSTWPFLPLQPASPFLLLVVFLAIFIQEAARHYLILPATRNAYTLLDKLAAAVSLPALTSSSKFHLALATGVGHSLAHFSFLYFSVVASANGPATFYTQLCPKLPLPVASACITSALMLLLMVCAPLAMMSPSAAAPTSQLLFLSNPATLIHLFAGLTVLPSLFHDGCFMSIGLSWSLSLLATAYLVFHIKRQDVPFS